MKLSEAVRLGSLLMTARPGTQDDGNGGGCGIGMALKARTIPVSSIHFAGEKEFEIETFDAAVEAWPWLGVTVERYACDCFDVQNYHYNYAAYLAHLFDEHVCQFAPCDDGDVSIASPWTLEEFFTYIESIEPCEFPSEAQLREALAVA
jgi:hypothetical protein